MPLMTLPIRLSCAQLHVKSAELKHPGKTLMLGTLLWSDGGPVDTSAATLDLSQRAGAQTPHEKGASATTSAGLARSVFSLAH